MLKKSVVICLMLAALPIRAAVWSVVYPQSMVENDSRHEFPLAVLELALQQTSVRYELKPSQTPMRQSKALSRLEDNLEINVLWSMTDNQREQQLLPIRIPITRGLIGWRVFLTNKNSAFVDAPIKDMQALLQYSPVQGETWPDTKILQANGFNVVTSQDYVEATNILKEQLADFFPRSIIEAQAELSNSYSKSFVLRKNVMVYYPAALYFFTNKQNPTLAKLIETGLNRAIENGSFQALFEKHYGDMLAQLGAENPQFFRLANPLLPPLTPLSEDKYWQLPPTLTR